MDLKTRGVAPLGVERAAIESVLGASDGDATHDGVGGSALRANRHLLLPTLHAVNDRVGWISPAAIDHIAERLDVSPAEIYGVVTFYSLFSTQERRGRQVHACVDLVCRARGVSEDRLPDGVHPSPCLGMCDHAPAALVTEAGEPARRVALGDVSSDVSSDPIVSSPTRHPIPQAGDPDLVLLARAGRIDPLDFDAWVADGGLRALERARQIGPDAVIDLVDASGLLGRGGAAFPTARKWTAVKHQDAAPRHLVCNADESEPGTFKDRVLIEIDPFALLESMTIAALAADCAHGWIYLRGEYPDAEATLTSAIDTFRREGILGDGFDVTLRRGAGAYICGEETAIFNSIEGFRGEPRNKPPYPFEEGLFALPTVVNNVETLMNVPSIVLGRATANRRLFCLSGAVARPGVYEVELGSTLGAVIDGAGGLREGSELQAVLLGGAAGRFVSPESLDLVLDHESVSAAGLSLGSGVVMVLDQRVDLVDQIRRIAAFFRDESCGQCVPCRVGTVRQHEVLERLASGVRDGQIELLADIGRGMTDASICGLGQTAHHAIESAVVTLGAFER
ncbi:MAG TPA: NADH-ubiquinone oxidoreductase-F iron-sulfur binding region domain-containing protein [Ilumatobacteraceae bacterium]|nr:NADH-ubiquinone oxidoreductase-F iron-sulfur binding region domain-containing protein [Ilumatobacteraceae bacterium]